MLVRTFLLIIFFTEDINMLKNPNMKDFTAYSFSNILTLRTHLMNSTLGIIPQLDQIIKILGFYIKQIKWQIGEN